MIEVLTDDNLKLEKLKGCDSLTEDSKIWEDIVKYIEDCMVPCLSKPYDEQSGPLKNEFINFFAVIDSALLKLERVLNVLGPKMVDKIMSPDFCAALLLLLEEMRAEDEWSNAGFLKHCKNIFEWFQGTRTYYYLYDYKKIPEGRKYRDKVFEMCMLRLHRKLTKEKWKHYPAAIYCFRNIVNNWFRIQELSCPLPYIFPGILLQIDDHEVENKLEGLKCCLIILKKLNFAEHVITGYEIVIYEVLMKHIQYREDAVLSATLDCLLVLLPIFKSEKTGSSWTKYDDVFQIILNDISIESNVKRKEIYLKHLFPLIKESGNSPIRWKKKFLLIMTENLEICLHQSLKTPFTLQCLECLRAWLNVGWPVFNYKEDFEVIVLLFKIIMMCCEDNQPPPCENNQQTLMAEECVLKMLSLCTKEERELLLDDDDLDTSLINDYFISFWDNLKNMM